MLFSAMRHLLAHAAPVLVAQLASIGMMLIDTVVLGHVSATDLAAVAIGGGIQVSVVFALVGILQAVAPVVAQLSGARRDDQVAGVLQQGFWLALILVVPGFLFLRHPDSLLGLVPMDAAVELRVRAYLDCLSWGLPASLFYRTFYAFCNALGRPRVLMLIGLGGLSLHAVLAWGLATGALVGEPLGAVGCAISNVLIAWLACISGGLYLARSALGQRFQPFAHWQPPQWAMCRTLLRLGLPMGLSNLVEITAFTLVSLFIAPLGAEIVAGHRIIANLSALCYMLPLSLALATLSGIGQSLGARDWPKVHATLAAGLLLSVGLSTLVGGLLWLFAAPVIAGYTDDPAVRAVAASLIIYIALYQFFDALQTVAGHALRAYRITFLPMLMQTFCFWGIGLGGGWWLCYRADTPMGVEGFWLASVVSLIVAAALLGPLLWQAIRGLESTP